MSCEDCKPMLMYEDLDGCYHKNTDDCIKANKKVEERRKYRRVMVEYHRMFPKWLDCGHRCYMFQRGCRNYVEEFIKDLHQEGYVITKKEEV